jgi:hypothetical protein
MIRRVAVVAALAVAVVPLVVVTENVAVMCWAYSRNCRYYGEPVRVLDFIWNGLILARPFRSEKP